MGFILFQYSGQPVRIRVAEIKIISKYSDRKACLIKAPLKIIGIAAGQGTDVRRNILDL